MKLDEGQTYEKLSLDITPLIDIVFLLVLFFAVSTSFISEEDLEAMKTRLLGLTEDNTSLSSEMTATNQRIQELQINITSLEQLRDSKALQAQAMQNRLADQALKNQQLQQQTKQDSARLSQTSSQLAQASSQLGETKSRLDQVYAQLIDERTNRSKQEGLVFSLQDGLAAGRQDMLEMELKLTAADQASDGLKLDLAAARSKIKDQKTELDKFKEIADLDREQIERVLKAQQNLQSGLDDYLQSNRLGIKREKQRIILQLSDQILFDSGSPELKAEGSAVLQDVGNTIKTRLGDLEIQIGGHTDNIPITNKDSTWPSNWALSAARAVNVVRLLEDRVGIDSDLLSAVGYGEHRPIADNGTVEGRAKNRRIEMVLVPR